MFRYDDNDKVSKPREKQRKVTTSMRKVTYLNVNPDPKKREPVISEGWEIIREAVVSPKITQDDIAISIVGAKTVDNHMDKVPKKTYKNNRSNENLENEKPE
jgi:hypothetical protein